MVLQVAMITFEMHIQTSLKIPNVISRKTIYLTLLTSFRPNISFGVIKVRYWSRTVKSCK